MPDFDNLAAASRFAMPLHHQTCGLCKHFHRSPQQGGQPGMPAQGECRESLRVVTDPQPQVPREQADTPLGDLTVRQALPVLLSQQVISLYAPTNEAFPACGHYVRRLEVT